VSEWTVPVRVHVDGERPSHKTNNLLGSHVFIWSQTVQLVSPDGDILHKFLGAPRHTRLCVTDSRVHHTLDGELGASDFLEQLHLGLAKASLFEGRFAAATAGLERLAEGEGKAAREAAYWLPIAASNGTYPERGRELGPVCRGRLARAVERLCAALIEIPDAESMRDWRGTPGPGPGDWEIYADCLREVMFGAYQALLDAANEIMHRRDRAGRPLTRAERILGHHHRAYRELTGTLIGVDGPVLDRFHFSQNRSLGKQRTIRNNVVHCVMAEGWAHSPQIRRAVAAVRAQRALPDEQTAAQTIALQGEPPENFGDLSEALARYEEIHSALLAELADISDEETKAGLAWWESQPISVEFRLNRLGWHLHDHRMVIESILERLGRTRSEMERLAILIYRGLGELESASIGLSDDEHRAGELEELARTTRERVAGFLEHRAGELEELARTARERAA
jgi:hypothetical protein